MSSSNLEEAKFDTPKWNNTGHSTRKFDLDDFQECLRIETTKKQKTFLPPRPDAALPGAPEHLRMALDTDLEFSIQGIDAPVANAMRRVMLSDVPTIAIERVYVEKHKGVVPEETLAHRFGLIPLLVNSNVLVNETKEQAKEISMMAAAAPERPPVLNESHSKHTLVFSLKRDNVTSSNVSVYSDELRWEPLPGQEEWDVRVYPRILITKLAPGDQLHVTCHATKDNGAEHAKWSPVATASYRLMPKIIVDNSKLTSNAMKKEFVSVCPMKVFDIEDSGDVIVSNPKSCTMCRECVRDDKWNGVAKLQRERDHFLFSVESVGALSPDSIVEQSLDFLIDKCGKALQRLNDMGHD